ncbi:MAG TPA: PEGA domain-containing protein, partial [Candidatus Acidoferrales bacterium]|nr:PEGA domain-containing protein [Candidatus Acidoferrales bacterium]
AVAPGQKASDAAPIAAPPPPSRSAQKDLPGNIMCNFSSIPSGAEITLDGKYVGNTPSGIPLSAGTHTVVLFLPGFTQWKRDLTVSPGSDLTVSGILQKE